MANESFRCENDHVATDFCDRDLFFAVMNWEPGIKCAYCDKTVRWFGERPQPKALAHKKPPTLYEVLYIASFGDDAPDGDPWAREGYFPFVMVLKLESGRIELRTRYYLRPDHEDPNSGIRYGQDGPIFSPSEWRYITEQVDTFLSSCT